MSYQSEVLADSPLAYYRLDEASGTTMTDASGNGRNGVYTGAVGYGQPSLLPSDPDASLSVASGKYGSVADDATWMHPTQITVEAWVKPNTAGSGTIVGRANFGAANGPQYAWHLGMTSGAPQFTVFVNGTSTKAQVLSSTTYVAGTVLHLVGTFDGTNTTLYVNGASVRTTTGAQGTLSPAAGQNFYVGRETNGSSAFNGTVDEVAIYDHALTATRIATHYSVGTTVAASQNGAGSGSAQSSASAVVTQSIVGAVAASGSANAQANPSLTTTATGSGLGVSSGHAVASVGVDIVPASGAGAGISSAAADVERALAGFIAASGASSATADATSFAQPTGTDKTNRGNGVRLSGSATVDVQPPLEDDPPHLTTTPIHIITPTVPAPTLVNGRPQ